MSEFACKSTFCVINNPRYIITYEHNAAGDIIKDDIGKPVILTQEPTEYCDLTPQQICDSVLNKWISDGDNHTGAVLLCESAEGLEHLHCVFESSKTFRPLSVLKRLYPKIHIEPTKGSKKDVEDYINKVGKFEEKGEKIIAKSQVGEIKGCQGKRSDLISLYDVRDMIFAGRTPESIYKEFPQALKSKTSVEELFYLYRKETTSPERDVKVHWLFGGTGCGKSYTYIELCDKEGEENIYRVSDYDHPFDGYQGEPILILDEFRGRISYSYLLTLIDKYRSQVSARYSNKMTLWTEVYITSPFLPMELYSKVAERNDDIDKLEQLVRRIDNIVYCFKYEAEDNSGIFYCKYDCEFDIDTDGREIREICSSVKNQVARDGLFTIMPGLTTKFVENKNKNIC